MLNQHHSGRTLDLSIVIGKVLAIDIYEKVRAACFQD